MPTTIPYQSPVTLLFIAALAVVCVALLFAEARVLRHTTLSAESVPWLHRFALILRGVGVWWLIFGASGLLIPLFFTVVLRYSSGNANGDLSILLGNILYGAAMLALVTLGVTLALLLVGGGIVIYLALKGRGYAKG